MKYSSTVAAAVLAALLAGCGGEEGASNTLSAEPAPKIEQTGFGGQIQAMTSVNVTSVTSGTPTLLTATKACATGSLMVSGGCECQDDPGGAFAGRLKTMKPQGNGWYCECVNTSGDPAKHPVVAHVVCMTPNFTTASAP